MELMNPTTVVAGCSTIMQGLSAFGTIILLCFMAIACVATALLINYLLKKYWQPVTVFRYVTRVVDVPPHMTDLVDSPDTKKPIKGKS
jgi:hypothetical protein